MDEKDLQEKLENERFKGVYAKIDANYTIVNDKMDSNHKETTLILQQILEQTKKTNGRVTKLEETYVSKEVFDPLAKEVGFVRVIGRYPKAAMLAVVGLCTLTLVLGLGTIFKIF